MDDDTRIFFEGAVRWYDMILSPRIKTLGMITGVLSVPAVLFFIFFLVKSNSIAYAGGERLVHERTGRLEAMLGSVLSIRFAILDQAGLSYNEASQDPALQTQLIGHVLVSRDDMTDIAVTDARGKEVVRKSETTSARNALVDRSKNIEFLTVKEKGYYLGPIFSVQDKPMFLMGRAIPTSDGKGIHGAVFALFRADVMLDALKQAGEHGSSAFVVNDKGIVVAHSTLSYVSDAKDFSQNPAVQLAMHNESALARSYANNLTEKVMGSGAVLSISSDKGVVSTNWFVIVEVPAYEALATAASGRGISFVMLFALVIVAGVEAFFVIRKMQHPLEVMDRALSELAAGHMDYRLPASDSKEWKRVSTSMNGIGERFKQMEADLGKEREAVSTERTKLKLALSQISDGVIACNQNGNIMFVNKSAEDMTGRASHTLIGRHIDEVVHLFEDDKPISVSDFYSEAKANGLASVERASGLRLVTAENQERLVSARIGVLAKKDSSEHEGYMLSLRDVSHERFLEKVKADFVAITAHELRTPLTEVKWALSLLLGKEFGVLSAKQKNIIKRSGASTEHMIHLVDDLLSTASREVLQFRCEKTPQDLKKIVTEIIEMREKDAKKAGVVLVFKSRRAKLPLVAIDDGEMKIALNNLLQNALAYTPKGGKINITLAKSDQGVDIRVADTGIGILPEDAERVFIKFFRGKNAFKTVTEGNGLGLYVTKRIVDAHGGHVWVESEVDKGSMFGIHLPLV